MDTNVIFLLIARITPSTRIKRRITLVEELLLPQDILLSMTNLFDEISSLHSEWTRLDRATRLGWLAGEKVRLNALANQFARYISVRGGFSNDAEKAYARKLLEMIQAVDTEGAKTVNELRNEAIKELAQHLI